MSLSFAAAAIAQADPGPKVEALTVSTTAAHFTPSASFSRSTMSRGSARTMKRPFPATF